MPNRLGLTPTTTSIWTATSQERRSSTACDVTRRSTWYVKLFWTWQANCIFPITNIRPREIWFFLEQEQSHEWVVFRWICFRLIYLDWFFSSTNSFWQNVIFLEENWFSMGSFICGFASLGSVFEFWKKVIQPDFNFHLWFSHYTPRRFFSPSRGSLLPGPASRTTTLSNGRWPQPLLTESQVLTGEPGGRRWAVFVCLLIIFKFLFFCMEKSIGGVGTLITPVTECI